MKIGTVSLLEMDQDARRRVSVCDGGDDWRVICRGEYWQRESTVQIQHVDTGKFLGSSSTVKFTQQNCGHNCPILNHLEAFGRNNQDNYGYFVVEMGVHLSL